MNWHKWGETHRVPVILVVQCGSAARLRLPRARVAAASASAPVSLVAATIVLPTHNCHKACRKASYALSLFYRHRFLVCVPWLSTIPAITSIAGRTGRFRPIRARPLPSPTEFRFDRDLIKHITFLFLYQQAGVCVCENL